MKDLEHSLRIVDITYTFTEVGECCMIRGARNYRQRQGPHPELVIEGIRSTGGRYDIRITGDVGRSTEYELYLRAVQVRDGTERVLEGLDGATPQPYDPVAITTLLF